MTVKNVTVAPEYLSFYITGKRDIHVPLDHDRRGIVASSECINVVSIGTKATQPSRSGRSRNWHHKPSRPNSMVCWKHLSIV